MEKYYIKEKPVCPVCGKLADGASGEDRAPKPGDFSVCIYCLNIGKYGQDMSLSPVPLEELEELKAADPIFASEMEAIRALAEKISVERQKKMN